MSALLKPVPGPAAYSPEWYALRVFDPDRAERPVVFGASDAHLAVTNPLELFLLQTKRKPPIEVTEDMEVGSLMEPVVLEMYVRRSGNKIKTGIPMHFHPQHAFMGATLDAQVEDIDKREFAADAKTSSDRMFMANATAVDTNKYGAEGTDLVPVYTVFQMQQQCAVWDYPHVDVPVLFGRKYRCYRVERDETLIAAIVSAEKELAERILDDKPPEPNWTHPNTRECLRALHGLTKGLSVVLSENGYDRWLEVARRKNQIKDLEEQNSEDLNRILAEMQDAERALMPKGTKAIKRIYVRESVWTEADEQKVRESIGETKRASYERMQETKVE